jgi:hypothetical protein
VDLSKLAHPTSKHLDYVAFQKQFPLFVFDAAIQFVDYVNVAQLVTTAKQDALSLPTKQVDEKVVP